MFLTSIRSSSLGAHFFLCAVILGLSGCSSRYVYEDFEAKYQVPEVPTQFATGSKGWRLAGHFSYNNQGAMDISRRDTMWTGPFGSTYFHRDDVPVDRRDSFRVVDERYRFERSGGLLGLMGIYQGLHWFAGLTGGAALPGTKRNYFGIFGGYTQFIWGGRWAPLVSGGIFVNHIDVTGRGWSDIDQLSIGENGNPPPGEYHPQADTTSISDWELPMKFGILFRAHPAFQPYLLFYGNTISTWPQESEDHGRFEVDDSGISLGIRSEAYRDLILSLEGALMDYSGPMSYEGMGVKLALSVEYAFGS